MPANLRASLIPVLQWCREQRLQIIPGAGELDDRSETIDAAEPLQIEAQPEEDLLPAEDDPYSLSAAQLNGDWA